MGDFGGVREIGTATDNPRWGADVLKKVLWEKKQLQLQVQFALGVRLTHQVRAVVTAHVQGYTVPGEGMDTDGSRRDPAN